MIQGLDIGEKTSKFPIIQQTMIIDKIRKLKQEEPTQKNAAASDKLVGMWIKCDSCKEILYKEDVHQNLSVCPNCGKHFRLSARRRIAQIVDEGTFVEFHADIQTNDPLQFEGYKKKIEALQEKTHIKEAVTIGKGHIQGNSVVLAVMDGNFLMGSMGSVVGDKITYAIEYAIKQQLPLIIF